MKATSSNKTDTWQYWEPISVYKKALNSHPEERSDMLINLSFLLQSASTAQIPPAFGSSTHLHI